MEQDFLDLMPHTIMIEPYLDRDQYGRRIYGQAVQLRCLVSGVNQLVRAKDGAQVVSSTRVNIAGPATITNQDRITLPDGSRPDIAAVRTFADPTTGDMQNVEVYCT